MTQLHRTHLSPIERLQHFLLELFVVNPRARSWVRSLGAGFTIAVPLILGVIFNKQDYGLMASLSCLMYYSMPLTNIRHRMIHMMGYALLSVISVSLGFLCNLNPALTMPIFTITVFLGIVLIRHLAIGAPGIGFYFMMAALAQEMPVKASIVPTYIGLMVAGVIFCCLVGYVCSLYILSRHKPIPTPSKVAITVDGIILDALIIAITFGFALWITLHFHLLRGYYLAFATLVVLQGVNLRSAWRAQLHRTIGTMIGVAFVFLLIYFLPQNVWIIIAILFIANILTDAWTPRHYGLAMIFITPLSVYMAAFGYQIELSGAAFEDQMHLVLQARFFETIVGCIIGLIGSFFIHWKPLRRVGIAVLTPISKLFHGSSVKESN